MAALSGHYASITFASGYVANAHNWSIDWSAEALESTIYNSGAVRSYIPGLKSFSGSYECYLDDTTLIVAPGGTAASATFKPRSDGSRTYIGDIIVTGVSLGCSVDGIATANFTFQGTGALTPA